MNVVPDRPKIYHITHVRNLPQIVAAGNLWSDAKRIELGLDNEIVGMPKIKQRRLQELSVTCHPGTFVGQYVPFYFCPRSVMLYILHRGNHPDITYHEGQRPIVHLQADLFDVVQAADKQGVRWAFTKTNAGTFYTSFFGSTEKLSEVNWAAVSSTDFTSAAIKEGKQAEFLTLNSFPWRLIEKVGVLDAGVQQHVRQVLAGAAQQPPVTVEPSWYY